MITRGKLILTGFLTWLLMSVGAFVYEALQTQDWRTAEKSSLYILAGVASYALGLLIFGVKWPD